ncbi:alpha-crystallin B chain-like [Schistocerca piceifrons]|uniref:alpha-crystallin B chain-like n=1 Tax=Schistocerca piceifrons TaxID=274613 RepID=UPI001F5E75E5|nr:alpha-crystallin B chain-like [Schistocerca piceifrons]
MLHDNTIRPALQPLFTDPHKILNCGIHAFNILLNGRSSTLSVNHQKTYGLITKLLDKLLVIEGQRSEHDTRNGFISQYFMPSYVVPSDVDMAAITSWLSSNGYLTITISRISPPPAAPMKDNKDYPPKAGLDAIPPLTDIPQQQHYSCV